MVPAEQIIARFADSMPTCDAGTHVADDIATTSIFIAFSSQRQCTPVAMPVTGRPDGKSVPPGTSPMAPASDCVFYRPAAITVVGQNHWFRQSRWRSLNEVYYPAAKIGRVRISLWHCGIADGARKEH